MRTHQIVGKLEPPLSGFLVQRAVERSVPDPRQLAVRVHLQGVKNARQQSFRLGGAALVVQSCWQQVNELVHMYRSPVTAQANVLETVAA